MANTPTLRFGTDESIYIQREGRSKFTCPGDSTTTYCVTTVYEIVKCGDIGCTQLTGGVNGCARPISRSTCATRRTQLSTTPAMSALNSIWNEVMDAVQVWLVENEMTDLLGVLQEIKDNKGVILEYVAAEIESTTTVLAADFKAAIIEAITIIVPAAANLLPLTNPISFALLVWDIMNWDIFMVKAW